MNVNYAYVRTNKAADLKDIYNRLSMRDDLAVLKISDGIVFPLKQRDGVSFGAGGVIDGSNQYVELSGIERRVYGTYEFDNVYVDDSDVVYCGYLVNHWGHFLIEAVTRLWYIIEQNPDVDKYVFFIEDGATRTLSGNYKEFLNLLGVGDKIEIINRPTRYRNVIVPEVSFSYMRFTSKHYVNIFDTIAENVLNLHKKEECADKIFLSRSRFHIAQVAESGLDMLDNFFEKNGYRIIYPELLPLNDFVYFLQHAKECACESGTLPHNILFGYNGQHLTIIERNTILNPVQNAIDFTRNLNVTYIDGHYTIYPVSQGFGPYFLAYNKHLRNFAADHNYLPPDLCYSSKKYLERCLRKYFRIYKSEYYYAWGVADWYLPYVKTLREAYNETMEDLGDYIGGKRIFRARQYFEKRFIKMFIKKMIYALLRRTVS